MGPSSRVKEKFNAGPVPEEEIPEKRNDK